MTDSTCMYYTSIDPKTKRKVYVPYTYAEKKLQKRVVMAAQDHPRNKRKESGKNNRANRGDGYGRTDKETEKEDNYDNPDILS